MSAFVLTPAAEGDIHEILAYVERDNPSAVTEYPTAFAMPCSCSPSGRGSGIRGRTWPASPSGFGVYSYLIIYRPETKPLEVVRVLRGKRDVRRLLEE